MNDPIFGEVVYTYTRKQAIADGFQVPCPDELRIKAGAKFPVYFTRTLWDQYITPPASLESYGQSLNGRLWDVLYMWHFNVKAQRPEGTRMLYKVIFTMPYVRKPKAGENKGIDGAGEAYQKTVTLLSEIGPTDFDDPLPAITIMLPEDD